MTPPVSAAARARRLPRAYPTLRRGACFAFAWAIFAVSVLPAAVMALNARPQVQQALWQRLGRLPLVGAGLADGHAYYDQQVLPVEELRPLAPQPEHWQGRWYDSGRNYANFERWFGDHLGLRDLMIRSKNEIDFQLFRSSSRIYYGKDGELYGRNLSDNELPATENLLTTPERRSAIAQGVHDFAQALQQQGTTLVLIAPIEKQYFTRQRLPFFAPRLPDQSNFMALYDRLLADPALHMIDVRALLRAKQGQFPIFYRQDFHWTDLMAHTVAAATTNTIAALAGSPLRWRHALAYDYAPFTGAEARFAARLNADDIVREPVLRQTWTERHHNTAYDPKASGIEFVTDTLDDPALLPPTCMYGNSFSDGMLRAGLPEHYRSFLKLSRMVTLPEVPALVRGRCSYLIVQVLDLQADRWLSLRH